MMAMMNKSFKNGLFFLRKISVSICIYTESPIHPYALINERMDFYEKIY